MIEYRAFAAAYQTYQANSKATGEMVQLVKQIEFEQARIEIEAHG